MSRTQTDYSSFRIDTAPAGSELVHPLLVDFGGNAISQSASTPFLDLHEVPANLPNWDFVWNSNIQVVANHLYKLSLRIARLYNNLGIQDPEAVIDPTSPWAKYTTGTPGLQDNIFHGTDPDGNGRIGDVVDGARYADAIATLQSIIGTRSFSGSTYPAGDGWLPGNNTNTDGFVVSYGTTITHNIDELDRFLGAGSDSAPTGFTNSGSAGFWNAKAFRDGGGSVVWSVNAGLDLLNRAIGSRELSGATGNLLHRNELASHPKTGFADDQRNVTDLIGDLDDIIGNRTIASPAGTAYGTAALWAISNAGGTNDTTTLTTLLASLNTAIGHRIIEDASSYVLSGASGSTTTAWANLINKGIGNRTITNKGSAGTGRLLTADTQPIMSYIDALNTGIGARAYTMNDVNWALYGKNDKTITEAIEALNVAIGSRDYSLHAVNLGSSGITVTAAITSLSSAIGARTYTGAYLTASGKTLTESIQELSVAVGNLNTSIGAKTYSGVATGALADGESLTVSLTKLQNRMVAAEGSLTTLGTLNGTTGSSYYSSVNSTTRTVLGLAADGSDSHSNQMFDKLAFLLNGISINTTASPLTSREDATLNRTTSGWFTNTGNTSLLLVLQKIVDRIDDITGFNS